MGPPVAFSGFTPIPVTYSTKTTHYIYARSHSVTKKSDALPVGRTLFLVNVPPDATERGLTQLFKSAGTVERVVFSTDDVDELGHDAEDDDEDDEDGGEDNEAIETEGDKPRKRQKVSKEDAPKVTPLPSVPLRTLRQTGGSAHIVFLDSSSHDRAINTLSKPRPWPTTEEPRGLAHYLSLYDSLRPPLDVVQEHADKYIEVYEYELAKEKQKSKYKIGEAIVDEDGFTLVTRGGSYGQTLGGGVSVASKKFQQTGQTRTRNNKRKDKKEKEGFYAFQKAEKQRKGTVETISSSELFSCNYRRDNGSEAEVGGRQSEGRKAQSVKTIQALLSYFLRSNLTIKVVYEAIIPLRNFSKHPMSPVSMNILFCIPTLAFQFQTRKIIYRQ
jgi:ribosomal RNA-processing protein 7